MSKHNIMGDTLNNHITESPLFTVEVLDPEYQIKGWVVIHSMGAYGACGGVRLYPDVDLREVKLLAQAMTYKYSFFERQMGGAKAGLQMPFDLSIADRQKRLKRFGMHIGSLLRSYIYLPWTDMNSSMNDIKCIFEGAGLSMGTIGDSSYYTALSTFAGVKAAAEYYKIPPNECNITVEGVGNVGKHLIKDIANWGGKLIGVSTRCGGAVNPGGIDIDVMLKLIDTKKDDCVHEKGNWETTTTEAIFSLPMDIHVPCARTLSLTEQIASKITAKAIVPAANVPCTPAAEDVLANRAISLLPDFIINGGGIIGTSIGELGGSGDDIRNIFLNDFKNMIIRLLRISERNETPVKLARIEADKHFAALSASALKSVNLSQRIYRALEWRGLIPKTHRRKKAAEHLIKIVNERFQ